MDVDQFKQLVHMDGWLPESVELKTKDPRFQAWGALLSWAFATAGVIISSPPMPPDSFTAWFAVVALVATSITVVFFLWAGVFDAPIIRLTKDAIVVSGEGRSDKFQWSSCSEFIPDRFLPFVTCKYDGEALGATRLRQNFAYHPRDIELYVPRGMTREEFAAAMNILRRRA